MKSKHLLLLMLLTVFAPWAANAQNQLNEGFESTTFPPEDWTAIHVSGSNSWARNTAYNHTTSGAASAYMAYAYSGHENYLVTPKLMPNSGEALSFYATSQSYSGTTLTIEVSTTTPTAAAFTTTLATYTTGSSSSNYIGTNSLGTWVELTIPATALTAYVGQPIYIAFHVVDNNGSHLYLDDITGVTKYVSSTPKPQNLTPSNITHEGATLSWQAPSNATPSSYLYNYKKSADANWGPEGMVNNGTSVDITGLNALTEYQFRVKADYGTTGQSDYIETSFTTTNVATAVGDAWSDDFEGDACGWELVNGNLTNKWCWGTAVNNGGTHALYVSNDNGATNNYSGDNTKIFATKLLSFTDGKFEFIYDWRCKGESTYDFLRVALVPASQTLTAGTDYSTITQPGLPTGWIALDGGKLNLQETWQSKEVTINVAAGNYYLVLAWRNETGAYPPAAAVDNVSITRVACPYDVTGLAVATNPAVTESTATVTWTAGEATQWQVAYSANSNFEDATEEIVSAASYNMTSLTANTKYYVKVRAYCGGTDYGTWCDAISFYTECPQYTTIPAEGWAVNFDDMTGTTSGSTNNLPHCWNYINTSSNSTYQGYPVVYNYQSSSHSGNNHLRFLSYYYSSSSNPADQYAILPAIENVNTLRVKFYARANSTGSSSSVYDATFKVGVMEGTDASTFTEIASYTPESTTYQLYTVPLSSYTGTGTRIAFMIEAAQSGGASYTSYYRSVFIDDILVEEIPSCIEPSGFDVVANSITTNSVQLTWTAGGNETAWDIYCTTSAEAPTAATTPTVIGTTDNPCTVSGLTAATHYYAYVRSRCSDSEQSPWSAVKEFDTECDVVSTFPWMENFEGMTANTVPLCWDNSATTGTDYGSHPEYYWGVYSYGGNKMIRMYNYYAHGPLAIINTPTIVLPAEAKELTFDYTHNATSGVFSVKISEDGGTTFTELQSYTKGTGSSYEDPGTFTEATISLADYANKSVILQFYSAANYGSGAIFVDNIKIDVPPTCIKPSNLACDSKTAHTATLSWTNGEEGQNAWQIAYSTTADFNPDEVTPVDVTTNPATIEGLSQSTTYYAYVRANCGSEDGMSAWCNNKLTFTTLAGNVTPTGLAVAPASITSSQATASWNAVAGNTLHESYDIYWAPSPIISVPEEPAAPNLISGITATSQLITGLDPETQYLVWVRDNCGTDGLSAWSTAVTFTTVSACQTPDGLAESNVTNTSATITWNTYGLTDFNLRYSTDGTTWTTVENVNSPYTFPNNLTANTAYQVQVQAACADAETWSTVLNFRTECAPKTITETDYINEDFEYYTGTSYSTNGVVPYCWDNDADGNILPHVIGSGSYYYVHNGSKALTFYGSGNCYAYLPEFTNNLNTLQISFWARVESTSYGTLTLGYFDSENEFKVIDTYTSKSTMTEYTTYLGLKENVPDNARLVFRWYCDNQYSCCIDDVVVKLAPSCYPVENLTYSDVLATTVKLSWDLVDDTQDGWEVQYAEDADFTQFVNTVNAYSNDHYEITALNPETHYWMRVRGNCYPEGGYGEWSNVVDFTTLEACPAPSNLTASNLTQNTADLTWNGESESYNIQYRMAATMGTPIFSEDFSNGIGNWTMVDCHSSTGVSNGTFAFHWNTNPPQYMISPEITGITTDAILEFVYYNNSTQYEETFKVGLSSTDNSTASFSWSETLTVKDKDQHTYHATVPAGTKYMAIQLLSNDQYYLYIDDIVITNEIPAGAWEPTTPINTTESTATITGLTAGTKYEVQVQGVCNNVPGNWANATFTTMAEGNMVFTNATADGKWGTAGNWVPAGAPALTDEVIIRANATIESTCLAEANNITFEGTPTPTLTIADGGKLMTDNSVTATVKKNVASYGESTNGGYVLLTSPIGESSFASYNPATAGLITANEGDDYTYDLYEWLANPSDDNEWRNYRKNSFDLYHGEGYLYANKNDVELTFTGIVQANNVDVEKTDLDYGTEHFQAWNLYGNPFMCDAYLNDATSADMAFYRMNTNGDGFTAATGAIRPMEGVFVQTSAASQGFKFSRTQTETSRALLNVNLTKVTLRGVEGSSDNAIIRFDQGGTLEKFSFREDASKVYIPQDNIDYAVVSAEAMGELPVNFRANENGSYTLSFTSEEVSFSYLHLVDNMTGNDVDLLQTPSYTFDAFTTDYESRFKLVFATGNAAADSFAFYSNGNWIINNDGQATLQVIDVTGRILSSETVNGSVSTTINAAPGVYMLRLVNGDNVKVQKVVVR